LEPFLRSNTRLLVTTADELPSTKLILYLFVEVKLPSKPISVRGKQETKSKTTGNDFPPTGI